MKFFIDSADIEEIRKLNKFGIIDGVTTNPSLIKNSGKNYKMVLQEICQEVAGPISAEVVAIEKARMIEEGLKLSNIAKNIIIKVPCTTEGLAAAAILIKEGKKINVTLCFSAAQAIIAAKIGVDYISPFIGRLEDIGASGLQLIEDIRILYNNLYSNSNRANIKTEIKTEILAASIRSVEHVLESLRLGADAVTVPPKILHQMFQHPLTAQGLDIFLKDWAETKQMIE